jgi:outer membrane protein assembly factor BamB
VSGGVVYAADADDDTLYAISTSTHSQLWSFTADDIIGTTPAVANGTVYVTSLDGKLFALNAATGAQRWSFTLNPGPASALSPVVADGVVYATAENEIVYAFNGAAGKKLWSYSAGNQLQAAPVVANGRLYVGTGGLYAFGLR